MGEYLKEKELKEEIEKSRVKGSPTEQLKMFFILLIDKIIEKNNFKNYDEETKDIMKVKAYEALSLYWKNYSNKKTVFYIEKDREFLKRYLKENPKKFRIVKNKDKTLTKLGVTENEKEIEEKLKRENIKYKKEIIYPKAFSYFTQIITNAFLQIIKKRNFNYIIKSDNNNEVNIIKLKSKEDKEYFKEGIPASKEISYSNYSNNDKKTIEKVVKTYIQIKDECQKTKREGCITVETICDLHPAIQAALIEAQNFDEFIAILDFLYDKEEITAKDILSNPSIFYIIKKISEI